VAATLITCQGVFIGYEFELTGGAAPLDLTNTVSDRKTQPIDHLVSYRDLVDWAEQTRLLLPAAARRLRQAADASPARAQAVLRRALALRELLFRIFSAAPAGRPVDPADLAALDRWVARAYLRRHLTPSQDGVGWAWRQDDLDSMLWPVILAAADILTDDDERRRVRVCQGDDCAWLFLDRSRRRDRRWCDMASCGNRAKAKRHYARTKVQ
jgi:predicted RNA-binding Zn ribbon-like protein